MHWIVVLTALMGAETTNSTPTPVAPLGDYHLTNVRGWDVYVHKNLLREDKEIGDATMELIDHQLYGIVRVVPQPALGELQKMKIWVEQELSEDHPCACYHASGDWLKENGYLPEKEDGVEIASAKTFLEWTHAQPYMLLHELAHGYHDRVFGYDDARIIEAYQAAKKSGGYDEVLHINGSKRKHYALQNQMEYFAEATEAYFGTNDFYPFTNSELKQHDPEGYRLIESLWKDPYQKGKDSPEESDEDKASDGSDP